MNFQLKFLKRHFFFLGLLFFILCFYGCHTSDDGSSGFVVNPAHLNHLYDEMVVEGKRVGIIYIYADYPDYRPVVATGEGISCVDDVARAMVFYLRYFQQTGDSLYLHKTIRLLDFILALQAHGGMFYNFIFADGSINRLHKNSQARADWWTWRAMWALSEAMLYFHKTETQRADSLRTAIEKTFPAIDSLLQQYPATEQVAGLPVPDYLPAGSAANQAAILLLALENYYKLYPQERVKTWMVRLAEGIRLMQTGNEDVYPFGAIRSWKNIWHGWGNLQSTALLKMGVLLADSPSLEVGLQEVRGFYPKFLEWGFPRELVFQRKDDRIFATEQSQYPQIAYGIRPQVWACVQAYVATEDEFFLELAGKIAAWLVGNNSLKKLMYDPETGRCFDGINNESTINLNSGAESTVEALLTLQELQKYPRAWKIVESYYKHTLTVQNKE